MKINIQELENYANDFLMKTYGIRLTIPIEISKRMTSTLGYFYFSKSPKKPRLIRLSYYLVKNNSVDIILDVLRHELVHYACFVLGYPFRDGEEFFENELKRLGVTSGGTYTLDSKYYLYECDRCGEIITARTPSYASRYVHRDCGGRFRYILETE